MPATPQDMYDALTELANELSGLRPDWRSGELFYERRSSIQGKLRALANSPLAIKRVIRPVPMPVPQAPLTEPPVLPEGAALQVTLNADEQALLAQSITGKTGGFQYRYRKLAARLDPATGILPLTHDDVGWIWRQGSRPWKGGAQSRTRKIFWRALGRLYEQLGLTPITAIVVTPQEPEET